MLLLSMTGRAACQNCRLLNPKLLDQVAPFADFILCTIPLSPFHVENLFRISHKVFRTTMTLQAPFHLERGCLRNHRHLIDPPVAGRTPDALVHMNRVIEVRKVRQVVDPNPFQRLARLETGPHRFQVRTVGPDLFMTIHAHRGRRHAGRSRRLDRRVAIAAIDTIIANVMLMTELDWLLAFDPLARVPSRASNLCRDPKGREQNKDRAINRGPRKVVRAMTEDLWHCRREDMHPFSRRTCPPIIASGRDKSRL